MEPIRDTKQLPEDDWPGFFATFSTENRKHPVTVELISPELGDQILVKGAPLMAVDYDPPDKGANLILFRPSNIGISLRLHQVISAP